MTFSSFSVLTSARPTPLSLIAKERRRKVSWSVDCLEQDKHFVANAGNDKALQQLGSRVE